MQFKYCPLCGGTLEFRHIEQEGRRRLICSNCGYIFYRNPVPAAAVILFQHDKILLVKRKFEPQKGYWSLPAGFLEYEESPEQTAIRETKEETNLDIEITGLFGVFPAHDNYKKHVLVIVYRGKIIAGEPIAGDDAEDVRFFSLNNLPDKIAFSCHRNILRKILRERSLE